MVIIIGSPKPVIVSRASETHCGPAKIDFGWPDWPAREKVKHDPCKFKNEIQIFIYKVFKVMSLQKRLNNYIVKTCL